MLLVMRNAGGWYSFSFLSIPPPFPTVLHHPTPAVYWRITWSILLSSERPAIRADPHTAASYVLSSTDFLLFLFIGPPIAGNDDDETSYSGLHVVNIIPLQQPTVTTDCCAYHSDGCCGRWMLDLFVRRGRFDLCGWCCATARCFHYTWIDTLLLCEFFLFLFFFFVFYLSSIPNDLWWRRTASRCNNGLFLFSLCDSWGHYASLM